MNFTSPFITMPGLFFQWWAIPKLRDERNPLMIALSKIEKAYKCWNLVDSKIFLRKSLQNIEILQFSKYLNIAGRSPGRVSWDSQREWRPNLLQHDRGQPARRQYGKNAFIFRCPTWRHHGKSVEHFQLKSSWQRCQCFQC